MTILKEGDRVVPSHSVVNFSLPERPHYIHDVTRCSRRDKKCPKDCPGEISLDGKTSRCFAYMSKTSDRWKMGLLLERNFKKREQNVEENESLA